MSSAIKQRQASREAPVFVVKLRARPGIDGIRAMRAILKALLCRHQLRCIAIREEGAT
jgi:hypothetical protein